MALDNLQRRVEQLEVYDLEGNILGVQPRGQFYEEVRKEYDVNKTITKKVKLVMALISPSRGGVYSTQRSESKEDNGGLWDKTLGGHVPTNTSQNNTLVTECSDELDISAVVAEESEFDALIRSRDLSAMAVLKKIGYDPNFLSERRNKDGSLFRIPFMVTFYFGYYDGRVSFKDGECSGIRVYSLDDLARAAVQDTPQEFTSDIKAMIPIYKPYIIPLNTLPLIESP